MLALPACVAYHAQPVDPLAMLRELERSPLLAADDTSGGVVRMTADQAAGFAVTHNPALVARRADLGIAEAELVQAGVLPDPTIGWGAMDALAVKWTGGTPTTTEYLSGIDLMWPVPRPGEIGARTDAAEAHTDETRQRIIAAEWHLAGAVRRAFLEVSAADSRLALNAKVVEIAHHTAEFFDEARAVGGATAVQQSLAATELGTLEEARVRLEGERRTARERLNELLGVPPDTAVDLDVPEDPFAVVADDVDADALVERAVRTRPDLKALLSRYRAAEQELRLQVARQWPAIAIGTGISVVLPFFSRFNRPAIDVAVARRERLAREVRAAIHSIRAEAWAAVTALDNARREIRAFDEKVMPRVEASLARTNEAFREREVTLIEILTAQRQVLDARRGFLDARIRAAEARIRIQTVTGDGLRPTAGRDEEDER